MDLQNYLTPAVHALERYVSRCNYSRPQGPDLGAELVERIRQADWLFRRCAVLDDQMRGAMERARSLDAYPPDVKFELQLHTECFYYVATRAAEIVQNGWIDGLPPFACGIIPNIRHHLVEHSERKDGVVVRSWSFGGIDGPVLKPFRRQEASAAIEDPGLFANALALRESILDSVRRAYGT